MHPVSDEVAYGDFKTIGCPQQTSVPAPDFVTFTSCPQMLQT